MKILFDNGTPRPIAAVLTGHDVHRARKLGWHELENGDLLDMAEANSFDVLLTTDKNMRHQQNLAGRKIAIVVLGTPLWPRVQRQLARIAGAVEHATPGSYTEVDIE